MAPVDRKISVVFDGDIRCEKKTCVVVMGKRFHVLVAAGY